MNSLYLKQIEIGPMENFVYFVGDAGTREVFVVDPAWQVDTLLRVAKEEDLKIIGALVSHFHFDHTNGIEELLKSCDVPVYVHKKDIPFLDMSHQNIKPSEQGTVLKAGNIPIEIMHTPGHTQGSQCFHVDKKLISGDTLFINACGRCDLPGGDPRQMYETLSKKLLRMPDDTVLLPGHNYADRPTDTMAGQKKTNPYLMCDSLDNFLRFRMGM